MSRPSRVGDGRRPCAWRRRVPFGDQPRDHSGCLKALRACPCEHPLSRSASSGVPGDVILEEPRTLQIRAAPKSGHASRVHSYRKPANRSGARRCLRCVGSCGAPKAASKMQRCGPCACWVGGCKKRCCGMASTHLVQRWCAASQAVRCTRARIGEERIPEQKRMVWGSQRTQFRGRAQPRAATRKRTKKASHKTA